MTRTPEPYRIRPSETLYRVVLPLGLAMISFAQLPLMDPTPGAAIWVHMAVFVVGMFVAFNQAIKLLDRHLNWRSRFLTEHVIEEQKQ